MTTPCMTPPLIIRSRPAEQGLVVEVAGDVDLATVPTLRQTLWACLPPSPSAPSPAALILDMRHVDFIDSSGLALLMELCRSLRPLACPLSLLIAPNSQPERVFRIGRLDLAASVIYDLEDLSCSRR